MNNPKKSIKSPRKQDPVRRSARTNSGVNYCELKETENTKKAVKKLPVKLEIRDINDDTTKNLALETFQCTECNKHFNFRNSLSKHIKSDHEQMSFSCLVCDKSFNYQSNLQRHVNVKHCKPQLKFKCGLCSKYFQNSSTLKKHKRSFH